MTISVCDTFNLHFFMAILEVLNNCNNKWWNRELTLKCKLKCYVKSMKDPLGVSPSKGNQGTTRVFFRHVRSRTKETTHLSYTK